MILPLGGYKDDGSLDLGAAAAGILTGTAIALCCCACAYLGHWIGELAGYPVTGTMIGFLGIPMLAVLVNGQMAMRAERKRSARREGEKK